MSGSSGSNTTVQNTDPWSGQQPYLKEGFQGAQEGVLNQPGTVPFSPETQYGLSQQADRALQGSPLLGAANQQAMATMGGDYMSGGPGFNAFADSAWNAVRPQVDTAFEAGGRYGSNLHAESLGKGFGRAMAPLYDAERGRQMAATFGAPGLAMADYQDPQMLQGVGAAREGKAQQYADEPMRRLQNYMGLIGGGYGGTTTTSGGAGGSPLMSGMGGAMSGASLGSVFGPWGTGIGAVGGGLLGAFS
jgi:hypothetical protein